MNKVARECPVFWFTGLSGAGKSTVAEGVAKLLSKQGYRVTIIDGDSVRREYNAHLGFSAEDIVKNNNFISQLCQEKRDSYDLILVPIISPFKSSRVSAKQKLGSHFFEIYLNADLNCVVDRDTKGLYEKARRNELDNMIGYSKSAPYERPDNPDYTVNSLDDSVDKSIGDLFKFICSKLPNKSS